MPLNCEAECEGPDHHPTCEHAPMEITKDEFVAAAVGGAKAAVDTYLVLVDNEGLRPNEALEIVVEEAAESASCFAGIGSCGGGGCKHS